MKRFDRVKQILEDAVGGRNIGAHGNFWRGTTIDQFKAKVIFGRALLIVGNPDDSNIIKALEGRDPFGSDTGTPGALFQRMPADRPPVPADRIAFIRKWIADNCPDEEDTPPADPNRDNTYWRDFDDWAMFHATPEVQDAIGEFFNRAPKWMAFARDASKLPDWQAALAEAPAVAAFNLLGGRMLDTIRSHYGNPISAEDLLNSYEKFGANSLPDDPLRPADPRHNMNGEVMWFFYSAFVDGSLRAASPSPDWTLVGRAVLIGLINDGLFRGRFPVQGFTADAAGAQAARIFMRNLAAAELPAELARRFVDSGLAA